ncbi:MAG: spermidine synthase [Deltaproteobacteria bacterium]|nr:spermidine synthase [Deltaproteobacteria bacterium]
MSSLDFEVLAAEETEIGLIWLRDRAGAVELSLDHEFLMSSATTASERALASRAVALHGGPALRTLVGGLGLGATAHELLASPRVASVRVVELLAPVLDWHSRGLVPLACELRADARFSAERGDAYALLLAEPTSHYDLILVDVDHSPEERLGPSSDSFYAAENLAVAKRWLAPGGVLGVWSFAASPRFEAELRAVFADVQVERIAFANGVDARSEENWLYFARA